MSNAVQTDRRLRILQHLAEATGQIANESVVQTVLHQMFGHALSADLLRTELYWLAEQGLLETKTGGLRGDLLLTELTDRGADVAHGRAKAYGVSAVELLAPKKD